jgi:hypothetical protein
MPNHQINPCNAGAIHTGHPDGHLPIAFFSLGEGARSSSRNIALLSSDTRRLKMRLPYPNGLAERQNHRDDNEKNSECGSLFDNAQLSIRWRANDEHHYRISYDLVCTAGSTAED